MVSRPSAFKFGGELAPASARDAELDQGNTCRLSRKRVEGYPGLYRMCRTFILRGMRSIREVLTGRRLEAIVVRIFRPWCLDLLRGTKGGRRSARRSRGRSTLGQNLAQGRACGRNKVTAPSGARWPLEEDNATV